MNLPLFFTLVTLSLPTLLIIWMWKSRPSSKIEWLVGLSISAAIMVFVFLVGTWFFISSYLRIVFAVLLLITVLLSGRTARNLPVFVKSDKIRMSLRVAFLLVWIALDINVIQAYRYSDEAVDMSFPLRNGKYCVIQGGNSRVTNFFHSFGGSGRYALDIARLNKFGNRAKGITPERLSAYEIFGDIIYSPCDGTVIEVVDRLPDSMPGVVDVKNPAGNHIVIDHKGIRILLAHMMRESVLVKQGDVVLRGHALGRVGNSGNTIEPHLHISATGENNHSVPITFDGRFLSLNSLFESTIRSKTTTMQ